MYSNDIEVAAIDSIDGFKVKGSTVVGMELSPYGTEPGNTKELRFYGLGGNHVAFKSPDTITENLTWTLPGVAAVNNGYVLSSTTAGILSWAEQSTLSSGGVSKITASTSKVTVTEPLEVTDGSSAAPAFRFTSDPGLGLYRSTKYNTSAVQCVGPLAFSAPVTTFTGDYIVAATDSGIVLVKDSAGSQTITLPSAVIGFRVTIIYANTTGVLTVSSSSGDFIRRGGDSTGWITCQCSAVFSVLNMVAIDSINWVLVSEFGTWGMST